jgi:hypothetical protein
MDASISGQCVGYWTEQAYKSKLKRHSRDFSAGQCLAASLPATGMAMTIMVSLPGMLEHVIEPPNDLTRLYEE